MVGLAASHYEARKLKPEEPAGLRVMSYKKMTAQDQERAEFRQDSAGHRWISEQMTIWNIQDSQAMQELKKKNGRRGGRLEKI